MVFGLWVPFGDTRQPTWLLDLFVNFSMYVRVVSYDFSKYYLDVRLNENMFKPKALSNCYCMPTVLTFFWFVADYFYEFGIYFVQVWMICRCASYRWKKPASRENEELRLWKKNLRESGVRITAIVTYSVTKPRLHHSIYVINSTSRHEDACDATSWPASWCDMWWMATFTDDYNVVTKLNVTSWGLLWRDIMTKTLLFVVTVILMDLKWSCHWQLRLIVRWLTAREALMSASMINMLLMFAILFLC